MRKTSDAHCARSPQHDRPSSGTASGRPRATPQSLRTQARARSAQVVLGDTSGSGGIELENVPAARAWHDPNGQIAADECGAAGARHERGVVEDLVERHRECVGVAAKLA